MQWTLPDLVFVCCKDNFAIQVECLISGCIICTRCYLSFAKIRQDSILFRKRSDKSCEMSGKNNKRIWESSLMSSEWFLESTSHSLASNQATSQQTANGLNGSNTNTNTSHSLEVKSGAASQQTANGLKYLGQSRPLGSDETGTVIVHKGKTNKNTKQCINQSNKNTKQCTNQTNKNTNAPPNKQIVQE